MVGLVGRPGREGPRDHATGSPTVSSTPPTPGIWLFRSAKDSRWNADGVTADVLLEMRDRSMMDVMGHFAIPEEAEDVLSDLILAYGEIPNDLRFTCLKIAAQGEIQ